MNMIVSSAHRVFWGSASTVAGTARAPRPAASLHNAAFCANLTPDTVCSKRTSILPQHMQKVVASRGAFSSLPSRRLLGADGGPHGDRIRSLQLVTRAGSSAFRNVQMSDEAPVEFYATCFPGLEETVARELRDPCIGATHVIPAKAGVSFRGNDMQVGYRANLWLRSAIRVMILIARGGVGRQQSGAMEIYNFTRSAAKWGAYLYAEDMHFKVTGHAAECTDIHSGLLLSTRIKDAVCDSVRDQNNFKPRPAPKDKAPQLQLFAVAFRDQISLYRNMSGDSLHKRGYREAMHKASLNEAIAAGSLLMLGWDRVCENQHATLADPMCGSGTFLIEAAMIAKRQAPGLSRVAWPFESWHDFDRKLWEKAVADAEDSTCQWDGKIWGSDVHEGALWLASRDVEAAAVDDVVKLKLGSVKDMYLPQPPSMVVTNPPWGQRLEGQNDASPQRNNASGSLHETWTQLGLFLKRECPNATVGILNGENKGLTRELMLKADRRYPMSVGGVDARLLKYTMLPPKPARMG